MLETYPADLCRIDRRNSPPRHARALDRTEAPGSPHWPAVAASTALSVPGGGLCAVYVQPSLLGPGVVGPSLWPGWLTDPNTQRRFTAKVHRRSPTACWYWTGAIGSDGHGRFRAGSRTTATSRVVTAHLYAYQLEHGPFADRPPSGIDLVVRHRCDEASCQNPFVRREALVDRVEVRDLDRGSVAAGLRS